MTASDDVYGSFTYTDPDSDLNSDSEGFAYGYSCTMFKFHIAQIQTRILTPRDRYLSLKWLLYPYLGWEQKQYNVCEQAIVLNVCIFKNRTSKMKGKRKRRRYL